MTAAPAVSNTDSADVIRKHKASLLSLDHHMHKKLVVERVDGRFVRGSLKGFDSNMNLILQDALVIHEKAANPFSHQIANASHPDVCRSLGAAVLRGAVVAAVYGADGSLLVEKSSDPLA